MRDYRHRRQSAFKMLLTDFILCMTCTSKTCNKSPLLFKKRWDIWTQPTGSLYLCLVCLIQGLQPQ